MPFMIKQTSTGKWVARLGSLHSHTDFAEAARFATAQEAQRQACLEGESIWFISSDPIPCSRPKMVEGEKGGDDEETEEDAIMIDEEHVVSIEEDQDWYFTFGSGQVHDGRFMQGCYTIFRGTFRSARAKMCERYGLVWSFQYSSEEDAGVLRHGLTRV